MNFRVPKLMDAVLLTSHGGMEKLEYRSDIEVPTHKEDEVLINVKGAGINNTDINFALTKNGQSYSKETIEIIKTFLKLNDFKKINDKEDLRKHDLILFEVDNLFSHFGVLSENDEIWHHEGGFLSRKSHVTGELIDRIHSIYRLDLSVY